MVVTVPRPRTFLLLWLLFGAVFWNALFELHIAGGAREYLRQQAEFEAGLRPAPVMTEVLAKLRPLLGE